MMNDHMTIKDDADEIHLLLLRHRLGGGDCLQTETSASRVGNTVGDLQDKKFIINVMRIIIIQ